jgi:hypothetical protein
MVEKEVIGPGIVVYKNALTKDLCLAERLEAALEKEGSRFKWSGARVAYHNTDTNHRNCQDFKYTKQSLGEIDEYSEDLALIHDQVTDVLLECLKDYSSKYSVQIGWVGALNVVRYGPGEKFNRHADDGEPYRCTVSTVGYINDDYEGGDLYFDAFDITYTPNAGDFVIFPSSYIYTHASLPIINGIKYAIVTMTDRSSFAHHNDSPVYHTMEEREKRGLPPR